MYLLNNICHTENMDETCLNEGLCLYEVIRVFQGKPIFLKDNIERLKNSMKQSHISLPFDENSFRKRLEQFIKLQDIKEGNVKYALLYKDKDSNEFFFQIPHHYPTAEQYRDGVTTTTFHVERLHPNVKYINASLRTSADQLMKETGAFEIALVNHEEQITEGSRSNLFFIKNECIYTAPLEQVLPGTSRQRLIRICNENNIKVVECPIAMNELCSFDAAFITGTSPLVLPIKTMDNCNFNVNNSVLRRVMELYITYIKKNS